MTRYVKVPAQAIAELRGYLLQIAEESTQTANAALHNARMLGSLEVAEETQPEIGGGGAERPVSEREPFGPMPTPDDAVQCIREAVNDGPE